MIIGITGKSGAGKSTISRYINNNKEDILYISVDNVVEDNIKGNIIEKVNKELKEKYNMGPYPRVEIIDSWYEEDDEHKLIYSIFKRHIVEDTRERIKHYKKTGKDIIIDWFMLEVSELMDDCDIKLLVKAPMDLRKDRVIKRGNYKKGFFERNEKSHNTKNENLYDYIIDTTKDWKSEINKIFNISNPIIDSNNPKDLISVIVPVYNSEKYIERCINSITHQTYRNLEIIIVNDGSTDKTLDICKKLQYDDYRIKIINQENKGVSNARNTGIENSIGKYVAFVDSDDYIEPDMYEIMQRDIYEYSADISRARAYVYDRDGSVRHNYNDNSVIKFDNRYDIIHNFVNGELSIAVWDKLFKREVIGDVRFNENVFHEDTMFVWDVIRNANTIVYNKSQFYHYKKRMEGSLTSKKFDNENFSLGIYGKDFLEEIKKNSPSNINDAILFYFNCLYFILKIYVRDFDYVKQNKEYRVKILNILKEMKLLMEILNENNLISEKNKNNINQITEKVLLYKIKDGEYAKIEEVIYIDFGKQFRPFIKSLYPFDGRHKGLDDYKADIMVDQYESNEICILFLDVKDSEKEYIERKRVFVYKNIEELKQLIRNKYKGMVDNYNFDNVFHMTDDEKEYLFTLKILSEYLKNYSIENQKVKKLLEV